MPAWTKSYIRFVDKMNRRIGRFAMYGIFALVGVLLWSSISKTFFLPSLWTLEVAQFLMVAYYIIGGPYSIQLGSNVRMDLFYGNWSDRKKACYDAVSVMMLVFFLVVLLYGGLNSMAYSLGYFGKEPIGFLFGLIIGTEEIGHLERSPTAWRPYLWPIKLIMCIGFLLMLMQVSAELLKDIAKIRGDEI